MRTFALTALAFVLAACGGDAAEPDASSTVTGTSEATTSELAAEMPEAPALVVSGGGLRVGGGADEAVPFGSPFVDAVAAISTVRGEPTENLFVEMCEADYAQWAPGLAIYGQEGRLVGWALTDADDAVTADALRLGATRADLDARRAEVGESTLGTEFTVDGVAGLLNADGADGVVTHLFAGTTCIAR